MAGASRLKVFVAAAATAAAVPITHRPETRPRQPPRRIVVILIDTLRADHLPFYGYAKNTAPFLSRLAGESVVFDRAYSTSAWTAPATASVFSGVYPFQHNVVTGLAAFERMRKGGMKVDLDRVPEAIETMGEAMARAGYATYAVTGNVNIREEMGFAQGFERFWNVPSAKPAADELNAKVRGWKRSLLRAPRSFLYLHYMDPHGPYGRRAPWYDAAEPAGKLVSAYDSEISYVDSRIQELYDLLGWKDDTFLIVVADHGEAFGEHGAWGHSQNLFREVLDIPLLIRPPGGDGGGRRVLEPVSLIDILPTLRDVAGLPPDPRCEGMSLLPLLESGAAGPGGRHLLGHLVRKDRAGKVTRSVIHDGWKAIREWPGRRMLFRIDEDRAEEWDRSSELAALADSLEMRLLTLERSARKFTQETRQLEVGPETVEALKALGYVQ